MGTLALRNDEKIGLGAALVLHVALVGVLATQTMRSEVDVFPERITVSLATDVGMQSAAPKPVAESRASTAPTPGSAATRGTSDSGARVATANTSASRCDA